MSKFKIKFELPSEYFQDEVLKIVDEYCFGQINEKIYKTEKEYNLALINESKNASVSYSTKNANPNIPDSFKLYRSDNFDKSEYIQYIINKENELNKLEA